MRTSSVHGSGAPRWDKVNATELYDHKTDPDETVNLMLDKNDHISALAKLLSQVLRDKVANKRNTEAMGKVINLTEQKENKKPIENDSKKTKIGEQMTEEEDFLQKQ